MTSLEELLQYVREENRVCPLPAQWKELWKLLPDRRRVGLGWQPPLPLILAAWHYSSYEEKTERLKEHIECANSSGVFDLADNYLRNLSESDWHHRGE